MKKPFKEPRERWEKILRERLAVYKITHAAIGERVDAEATGVLQEMVASMREAYERVEYWDRMADTYRRMKR